MNGGCTSVSQTDSKICDGTSVLNDGYIPALSGVSDDTSSQWADQLLTMRRSGTENISLSFEVLGPGVPHDRVELVIFNCPERGIYAPSLNVYTDIILRSVVSSISLTPDRFITTKTFVDISCDHLIKFCVDFDGANSFRYFNLVLPYQNNSDFVFLGEVKFLNGGTEPCDPPEIITETVVKPSPDPTTPEIIHSTSQPDHGCTRSTVTADEEIGTTCDSCTVTAFTAGVVSAVITALLVAGISVAIHIAVYQCLYKPRLKSFSVAQPGSEGQTDDVTGDSDAIVYDVVNERVGTALKIKQNEAYGVAKSS